MPFVSSNYANHPRAAKNKWVCTRNSKLGAYASLPEKELRGDPNYCGQCVSYVTSVCPTIPVRTAEWKKGAPVKGNDKIVEGTAIATFDESGKYRGHAAIYVSQDETGIHVYDQWVTGNTPQPIHSRIIRWEGKGISNHGAGYYVVE